MPPRKTKNNIPEDYRQLIETGFLAPEPNGMTCADCGAPVFLFWEKELGIPTGKLIPAAVWGEAVTVVCRCCSFPNCTHRPI